MQFRIEPGTIQVVLRSLLPWMHTSAGHAKMVWLLARWADAVILGKEINCLRTLLIKNRLEKKTPLNLPPKLRELVADDVLAHEWGINCVACKWVSASQGSQTLVLTSSEARKWTKH